jgi:ATP-binding cassette subfamily B protein
VKLLCRLYDPSAGAVRLGDTDVRAFAPADFRRRISVLFQDALPLDMTTATNIGCSDLERGASGEAVRAAAAFAGVHDLLAQLPAGYETLLGKRLGPGAELSAGEWRRLLLARALFRRADILVLDEPSAFLDARAERELIARLAASPRERTIVLADHRPEAVRWVDRIHVLDGGRIVESGSHDELVARRGAYAALFATGR